MRAAIRSAAVSGDHSVAISAGARHQRPLLIALGLTATFMLVELVAGIAARSVALMSDALHMGTDVLGLGMASAAVRFTQRPAPSHRTYGTYRLEVLATLGNGLLLFGVAIHDLHLWTLTSGIEAASCHLVATSARPDLERILRSAHDAFAERQVAHATIQVDPRGYAHTPPLV